MIYLIWAQDINGGISKNNKLPWHIKSEMQHFVNTTKNKTVVMGRKTYDSIGHTLPNRKNLVLTYNNDLNLPGVTIYHDISKLINDHINEDLYVIGGKQIYEEFSKYADFYIVSYINNSYDCDIYMDKIDFSNFEIIKQDTTKPEFSIKWFKRKK